MTTDNAPDRIWATVNGMSTRLPDGARQLIGGWSQDSSRPGVMEYVRADLTEITTHRKELAEARAENETLAKAMYWFSLYPEFVPDIERFDEWKADIEAARPFVRPPSKAKGEKNHDPMNIVDSCEDPRLTAAGYKVVSSCGGTQWHWCSPDGIWRDGFKTEIAAVRSALRRAVDGETKP